MYIVWYTGEYDLDDFGNVYTCHSFFDDFNAAKEAADQWCKDTMYIATIEYVAD